MILQNNLSSFTADVKNQTIIETNSVKAVHIAWQSFQTEAKFSHC